MNELLQIDLWQLISSYFFLILLLIMSFLLRLKRGMEFLTAAVRMTLQLVAAGYLLELVFNLQNVFITLTLFLFMQMFAMATILSRAKLNINPRLKKVVISSMFLGTTLPLAYFLVVVIAADPWYEPRFFIPIAGMIVGNSMTGISLAVERLSKSFLSNRLQIEEALMLGATPQMAVGDYLSETFNAAIIPTINSMLGMGIVFLPGMMTGQILAGVSPLSAIKYQIVIMMGILGSVALTVFLIVRLGYRAYFNERSQLIINRE